MKGSKLVQVGEGVRSNDGPDYMVGSERWLPLVEFVFGLGGSGFGLTMMVVLRPIVIGGWLR